MLSKRGDVMAVYEVGIFNRYIRAKVRNGDALAPGVDPVWEETNLFEIEANSAERAGEIILIKYPASQGFVIDGIFKLNG
jgi:hypothetical protein